MKINTYNKGTIIGVINGNTVNYYSVEDGSRIISPSIIKTLSMDKFVVSCTGFKKNCFCPQRALLSNGGFCLLSNSGAFLVSNN